MEKAKDAKKPVTSVAHVDTGKNMTTGATVAQHEAHFREAEEEAQHHKEKAEVMHQIADDVAEKAEQAKLKAVAAKAKAERVGKIMGKKQMGRDAEDALNR